MEEKAIITANDVAYVAKLANLQFTPQEENDMAEKMGAILNYMQQLQTIDTTGIPITTHVLAIHNVFREDEPHPGLSTEEALANAPDREDNLFKVPRII